MGRRRALVSSLKKAIICESKQNRKRKIRKSVKWFGKQRSIDLDKSENAPPPPAIPQVHSPTEEEVKLIESENEENNNNMHAYSVALATAMAAEAAVAAAHAAAEVVRLRGGPRHFNEEIAAVRIQTAFRGYMARRALRALRGFLRLKPLIGGQSDKPRVSTTLRCMETMARLQSQMRFRRIRMSEDNPVLLQQQIPQKYEPDKSRVSTGENWDDSLQSKEKIEENLHNRQEAAMRRDRALAYAYSHQQTWRNSENQTILNNPRCGWSWLERWMAENGANAVVPEEQLNSDFDSPKSTVSSVGARNQARSSTRNSKVRGRRMVKSPRRASVGTEDDSKSEQSFQFRRHSTTACSPLRDDESITSSTSGVRSYMAPTESARAKLRGPSIVSAKSRLSLTASPRRH